MLRIIYRLLFFCFIVLTLVCCHTDTYSRQNILTIKDFNNSDVRIGVLTGTSYDSYAKKFFPKAKRIYVDTIFDLVAFLKHKKIDAIILDEPVAKYLMLSHSNTTYVNEALASSEFAFAFAKNNFSDKLRKEFNSFLKEIQQNGELDRISKLWFSKKEAEQKIDFNLLSGKNGTITVAVNMTFPPFVYLRDNKPRGLDLDLLYRFCNKFGYKVNLLNTNEGTLITALNSKADIAASGLEISSERAKSVNFSIPYLKNHIILFILEQKTITKLADLSGKKIGVTTGSVYESLINQSGKIKNIDEFRYFQVPSDEIVALRTGAVDAVALDAPLAMIAVNKDPELMIIPEPISLDYYGFGVNKSYPYLSQINATLKELKQDGTLEKLKNKWLGADETIKKVINQDWNGKNGLIKFGGNNNPPMGYIGSNGQPEGLAFDIILHIGKKLNFKVDILVLDTDAVVPSLNQGIVDVGGCGLSITEERKKSLDFTDPYFDGAVVAVVKQEVKADKSWQEQFVENFKNTFIEENRWNLILNGTLTTIKISLFAAIFGTLIAFIVCFMRRSKNYLLFAISTVFIRLMQGTPVLVILLILFYIVFAESSINAEQVAICAFSFYFAAYVSEAFRVGIMAVDNGQMEAARSLGFSKAYAFLYIVLPQAACHFLPVYKGCFIYMFKETAVVGYISVQDLTKVNELIRSRTLDALFPILVSALIYFLLTYFFIYILGKLELKLKPKIQA